MATKPFSPTEVQKIIQFLHKPAVFLNMTDDWPGREWTLEHLALCLGEKSVCFRIGKQTEEKAPLFETECTYVKATLAEFLCWTRGSSDSSVGPFTAYPLSEYWAYADYKYLALLFQDNTAMFKGVVWSDFGYPGRDGRESTLWIGTNGANTPCHLDSYGCNLVFQVQGRKRWHLFPPEDAECLYPTRIPYEESSVFSKVSVIKPDLCIFPAFRRARAHVVTLQPGQVLFVPRHWWHYVESIDPVTVSVNSWIEMEVDDEARVEEALTKTIVCALKTTPSLDNKDNWLNPTEFPSDLTSFQSCVLQTRLRNKQLQISKRLPCPKTVLRFSLKTVQSLRLQIHLVKKRESGYQEGQQKMEDIVKSTAIYPPMMCWIACCILMSSPWLHN
ncbi:HSPB1-associated protein 1 homolog isoform X3 [Pygocentrus nattereri]|uniref:HSPB1-associated protein 1 homolog isoform X3 n=1 Tax=Pygocentrus nattereri TaxID=42514 RepID=UPI0008143D70|nr:HSPB1-associated protein 1 homolog isoform X3 [Pygocentrus nattereri]